MKNKLSSYQIFVMAILAFLQFTVILDFMILSPLGALLMDRMHITPSRFGTVVSAYALSAGVSGLAAASFADRFDRKRLLLVFYTGFLMGTLFCGLAPDFYTLLLARVVTGMFGGVIGSISFAIVADLFPYEVRGRVMGAIMTAFAVSQVMGLPLGLFFSDLWGWHAPFLFIVALGAPVWLLIAFRMKPVRDHLGELRDRKAFLHVLNTLRNGRYLFAFSATAFLATGGFMLMPFGSTFSVHNLGIAYERLPMVYMMTGLTSIIAGPILGRISDNFGKYPVFLFGSLLSAAIVLYYTTLGTTPLWLVVLITMVMFFGISGRMVSASALTSAIPEAKDRGAFMSINSSMQQISGGVASFLAGLIVVQAPDGKLEHYRELGEVVAVAMVLTIVLMYFLNRFVEEKISRESTEEAATPSDLETV